MEAEVIYYCEDHDDVDFDMLSECFGNPEDVANDFLSEIGVQAVNTSNRTKQYILCFFISLAVVITIIAAVLEAYTNYKQQQALDGYFVESITYEGELSPSVTGPIFAEEHVYSEEDFSEN